MIAVNVTDGGSPDSSVMKLTVIVVLPPPGRSPTQSILFEAGAPHVKPFEPAAPTNVTPAVGKSSSMWTPVACAVPPSTATTVYFNPCPGATGSGLSVIVEIARSKPVDPIADTTVESLLMRCTTGSSSHCVGSLQAVVSTSAGAAAAVFAIGIAALSFTLARIVTCAEPPGSMPVPLSWHVTVPAASAHVHPLFGVALMNVTSFGSVSESVRPLLTPSQPLAFASPLFEIEIV